MNTVAATQAERLVSVRLGTFAGPHGNGQEAPNAAVRVPVG